MAEKNGGSGTVRIVSAGLLATLVLVVISNVDFDPQNIGASIRANVRAGGESFKKGMLQDAERSKPMLSKSGYPYCSDLKAQGAEIGTITVCCGPDGGERTAYAPAYRSGRKCVVTEGEVQ